MPIALVKFQSNKSSFIIIIFFYGNMTRITTQPQGLQ